MNQRHKQRNSIVLAFNPSERAERFTDLRSFFFFIFASFIETVIRRVKTSMLKAILQCMYNVIDSNRSHTRVLVFI